MLRQRWLAPCLFAVAIFSGSVSVSGFAAQIAKVKGQKALIGLDGEKFNAGDTYYAMSGSKRKAKLKILKVSGARAIAKITAGKAAVGMTLMPASSGHAGSRSRGGGSSSAPTSSTPGAQRSYWGAMVGYAQDTMSVNINNYLPPGNSLGTVGLSGTGYSLTGLFDYEVWNQIWFRGTVGLESFNAAGTNKCGVNNLQACNAQINYFGLDFIARYVFATGTIRPWLGAGVGLLFPASKKATALDSSSVGTTNVMLVEGGVDWFISPTMYIPVSLEYGLLPKSDQVDAHWIALRVGLAVPF